MRERTNREPLRVVADQRAVGEALAAALTIRGVVASSADSGDWASDRPHLSGRDRAGVFSCAVDDGLALAAAQAFLCRSSRAWVVVTDPPADARWGALLAVGACEVVGSGRDLDELLSALERVGSGGPDRQDPALALFRDWTTGYPAEARTLACLSQMAAAERTALRWLLRGRPCHEPAPDAGEDDVAAATATALRTLGVHDEVVAAARLRALDASSLFARRAHVPSV